MGKRLLLLAAVLMIGAVVSYAQMSSKEIEKLASEQSEEYRKEGWKANVGSMPLKYQLIKAYTMQEEVVNGHNKYIIADGKVKGAAFEAARVHAMEMAKRNMISMIDNMTFTDSEGNTINVEGSDIESESLQETRYKTSSSLNLGNLIPVLTCYRELPEGKVEVLVKLACTRDNVVKALLKRAKSEAKTQDSAPKVTSSHTL